MDRQKVRLVTFAWGRHHLNDLMDFAIAAALAPGNLPALASVFDCSVVIVTEAYLFDYVRANPTIKKLEAICPLRLVALDDLISEPWQYGMTLTYAISRGFEDLGPAVTDTYLLFLNSDFVLADGCYARLIDRIRKGERIHLSPSYCVTSELVKPQLSKRKNNDVLSIRPREMASLILKHRHNTVRAKTVNQTLLEFEYNDQFYWRVDADTLIGYQMPISIIGMQPERWVTDLNAFWDWGLAYEFCPSKRVSVIGDSDDFLMMELRAENKLMESIRVGRSSPRAVARRMRGYITQYQIDHAQFPLVLHSGELPSDLTLAGAKLKAHVDATLSYLPANIDHANHAQWKYHKRHFRARLERRMTHARTGRAAPEAGGGKEPSQRRPVYRWMPARKRVSHMWHPYRSSRHPLRTAIRATANGRALHILALCAADSFLLRVLDRCPGDHIHLTSASGLEGALDTWPQAVPKFDLCLIELSEMTDGSAADLFGAVIDRVREDGKVLFLWHDRCDVPLNWVSNDIAKCIIAQGCDANVHYVGSWASAQGPGMYLPGRRYAQRVSRLALAAAAAATKAPLDAIANLLSRRDEFRFQVPKHCTGVVVEIAPSSATLTPRRTPRRSKRPHVATVDLFFNANPEFTKWMIETGLLQEPFVVIDVGVLGGENPRWHFLGDHLVVHGFDAIKEAIDDLRRTSRKNRNYHALAIGNENGRRQLFFKPGNPSNSSFYETPEAGIQARTVDVRTLDSLLKERVIPCADFLKIDVEGFEKDVLLGAKDLLSAGVLGLECETNFATSVVHPKSHFGSIHDIVLQHGLHLFDLNFDRITRASYQGACRRRNLPLSPSEAGGKPATFNVLFCRDLTAERDGTLYYEKKPPHPTVDQVLKMMAIYELHGLIDIAVDTAVKFSGELGRRMDVEHAVDLLCRQAVRPDQPSAIL